MDVQHSGAVAVAAPTISPEGDGAPARCRNCAAVVHGPYCHGCGEEHARNQILPLGALIKRQWRRFIGFDTRILRTLRLILLKPGAATVEYLDGRRRSYLQPWRMYLAFSAIYFLILTFYTPQSMNAVQMLHAQNPEMLAALSAEMNVPVELLIERFQAHFMTALSYVRMAAIPLLAFVLKLIYNDRYLHAHVVFALHFGVFGMMMTGAFIPLGLLGTNAYLDAVNMDYFAVARALVGSAYLLLAMKHVYGERWRTTLLKFVVAMIGYQLLMVLAGVATGAYATVRAITG